MPSMAQPTLTASSAVVLLFKIYSVILNRPLRSLWFSCSFLNYLPKEVIVMRVNGEKICLEKPLTLAAYLATNFWRFSARFGLSVGRSFFSKKKVESARESTIIPITARFARGSLRKFKFF